MNNKEMAEILRYHEQACRWGNSGMDKILLAGADALELMDELRGMAKDTLKLIELENSLDYKRESSALNPINSLRTIQVALRKDYEPLLRKLAGDDHIVDANKMVDPAGDTTAMIHDLSTPTNHLGEWISVDDELPGQAVRVLIFARFHHAKCIMTGCLQRKRWIIEGVFPDATVTHWRPLPEPPKGE